MVDANMITHMKDMKDGKGSQIKKSHYFTYLIIEWLIYLFIFSFLG